MTRWSNQQAKDWYVDQPWLVGCNFLPSSAVNQLEMFQQETFDKKTIEREVGWAKSLGFNSLRVYLHDLLWSYDPKGFSDRLDNFLNICNKHSIRPILVLFDDCHRPYPKTGKQPLPVIGVHNSGWKQSPGVELVHAVHSEKAGKELIRLKDFVQGVLTKFSEDQRILMWDIYNEPGQFGVGTQSLTLLKLAWEWSHEVRPSQPLTACLDGSGGDEIIELNRVNSDVITFHCYEGTKLEQVIKNHLKLNRPMICTEYMAREFGTTFEFSLPIFKKYEVGCYNWGLVAGKSQTHFGWSTITDLKKLKKEERFLNPDDPIPEPEKWFHDIFRVDGSAFDDAEVRFIKSIIKEV